MRKKIRQKVYQKYNGKCAYCGCIIDYNEMQVDHIISKRNFPMHEYDYDVNDEINMNPSCRSCNKFKDVFSIETFRQEISKQIDRLRRDRPTFRLAERFGLIECKEQKQVTFYFEK